MLRRRGARIAGRGVGSGDGPRGTDDPAGARRDADEPVPPSVGGSRATPSASRALAAKGAEVHVTRRATGHPAHATEGTLHVHRVGAPPGVVGSAARHDRVRGRRRAPRGVDATARGRGARAAALSPSSAALLLSAFTGTPISLNPHACGAIGDVGVLSATALGRLRLRATVLRADAFVAISGAIAAELRDAGVPPERIHAVPNGVDVGAVPPCRCGGARRLRIAPGSRKGRSSSTPAGRRGRRASTCSSRRGHVVAQLPSARLWMLGDGADRARLEAARAAGVADVITLPGSVADVAPYVRAADVAVLPSRTEGCRSRCSRRWRAPCPVVATAVGGSAEVLRDGTTGRLVAPERPDALADALVEALHDPAARPRARAAREEVVARYALDHVADAFLEVYARLRRDDPAAGEGRESRWPTPSRRRARRGGRVAYLMSWFPAPTETFILHELLELRRQGLEIDVSAPRRRARPTSPRGGRDGRAHALPPRPLGRAPRSAASLARAQAARLPARVGPRGPRQPPPPWASSPARSWSCARHS